MPLQPAILGTARLGNFRLGYRPGALTALRATKSRITLAGVAGRVREAGLTIHDVLNDNPNTCDLTVERPAPTVEQSLRVSINSDVPRLLFNGALQQVELRYAGDPPLPEYPSSAIDDAAQANRHRPFGTWVDTSATTIGIALAGVAGMSAAGIAAGLPLVSVNLDGSEGINGAFAQLAKLIGGAFKFEDGIAYLFEEDTSDPPDAIDNTPGRFLDDPPITLSVDSSQLLTRAYGKGHGEATIAPVAAGASVIPLPNAAAWFNPGGGEAIALTSRLTYAGLGSGMTPTLAMWTVRAAPSPLRSWTSVTWAPALGLFVAVAQSATATDVMTSPDGITWTARTPAAHSTWQAVAWAPSLTLFAAVSGGGLVMTSPDGITWTPQTAATGNAWSGIVWSPDRSLFVAVSSTAVTGAVMTSPDGITWTARTAPLVGWKGVTWAPALGLFAACASGANGIMTSPDGVTWTQQTAPKGGQAIAWAPALGLFVAVGSGTPVSSPDGITWTAGVAPSANTWAALIWVAELGLFLAASSDGAGDSANRLMSSGDGLTWTAIATPSVGAWRGVAWAPSLAQLVAVGLTGSAAQILTNQSLTYDTLTGVTGLTEDLAAGSPVNIWVQRDDLAAQAAQAAIDAANGVSPADGIYEGPPIVDERRNQASLIALCDATLAERSRPIVTVTYACRDPKTKSGKVVHIHVASLGIGPIDLLIQSVDITEIDLYPGVNPRFSVVASSVRESLDALLRQLLAATA